MEEETSRAVLTPLPEDRNGVSAAEPNDADIFILTIRRAAKRRRRLLAWLLPLIFVGMAATVLIFSRVDFRLSLTIFGVSAAIVAFGLGREACQWERLAAAAVSHNDVRAIGPLLTVLNDRDSSAGAHIEEALIELLPRVGRLNQLSRTARTELNRLLLEFEMPGLRGGHNAELARTALELVVRFRDCSALPAVRRLAEGFTATRPAAAIRDLASDILPDLEVRAGLLRPSRPEMPPDRCYLRPAHCSVHRYEQDELLRPIHSESAVIAAPGAEGAWLTAVNGAARVGLVADSADAAHHAATARLSA